MTRMQITQVPSPHNRPRPGDITHLTLHWMAGRIAAADATFRNPRNAPNGSSAHYGIAGSLIHQYVQESRRAGSDGNGASNDTTISIEHEGGWVENGAYVKPSHETHETSAQLVADIFRRRFPGATPVWGVNVFPHNHYVSTMCPGTLDGDWIVQRARELLGGAAPAGLPAGTGGVPAPAFPLPGGWYFGPKSGPRESVSGYFSYRGELRQWQQRMRDRGWGIGVDGLYGPETAQIARSFQAEKGLTVDGLIGPQTWGAAWTAPIT